tara:strand:+ start:834 stop:992 length:159 start_codon:yes stop_codon:yes gene_type:complete
MFGTLLQQVIKESGLISKVKDQQTGGTKVTRVKVNKKKKTSNSKSKNLKIQK